MTSRFAITDFDFVLKREPNDRLALFNRATLSELTGNYNSAIRDYTTVLEQYPNFLTGYENRARCYRAIGDNKNALADERKVYIARLDEAFGTKKNTTRETRKQKEQNIDDYGKIVVENDEDNLAKFYSNDYRGRIQNRDVAVALQPMFTFTFSKVDNGLSKRYNYAAFVERINVTKELYYPLYLSTYEAQTDITDIDIIHKEDARVVDLISTHKDAAQLHFYHAVYLAAERNYIDAMTSLDNAIKNAPDHVAALFLRASLKARQAEINLQYSPAGKKSIDAANMKGEEYNILIKSAIQDITDAIMADDTCPYLYYNRGCLYAKIKDNENALKDFNSALQLNSSLGEAYYNRGILNIQGGNAQEGFEELSKAGEHGLYSAYSLIKHFRKQNTTGNKKE